MSKYQAGDTVVRSWGDTNARLEDSEGNCVYYITIKVGDEFIVHSVDWVSDTVDLFHNTKKDHVIKGCTASYFKLKEKEEKEETKQMTTPKKIVTVRSRVSSDDNSSTDRITQIKTLRESCGYGLREAKDICDKIYYNNQAKVEVELLPTVVMRDFNKYFEIIGGDGAFNLNDKLKTLAIEALQAGDVQAAKTVLSML